MEKTLKVERVGSIKTDVNGNEYVMLYPEPTIKGNVFHPSTPLYCPATFVDALMKLFDSEQGLRIAV